MIIVFHLPFIRNLDSERNEFLTNIRKLGTYKLFNNHLIQDWTSTSLIIHLWHVALVIIYYEIG